MRAWPLSGREREGGKVVVRARTDTGRARRRCFRYKCSQHAATAERRSRAVTVLCPPILYSSSHRKLRRALLRDARYSCME